MVNYLAILVAAIVTNIIGFLWYGPLFGKQWMKLSGISMPKGKKPSMAKPMVINFVASLVTAYVLSLFVVGGTISSAIATGFLIWLGFFAAIMLGSVLWEMKPFSLYLLNVVHWLIALEVMAIVLAAWV